MPACLLPAAAIFATATANATKKYKEEGKIQKRETRFSPGELRCRTETKPPPQWIFVDFLSWSLKSATATAAQFGKMVYTVRVRPKKIEKKRQQKMGKNYYKILRDAA